MVFLLAFYSQQLSTFVSGLRQSTTASSWWCPKLKLVMPFFINWARPVDWTPRGAGKAAKHTCVCQNPILRPQYGFASRLDCGVRHLRHDLQQPFLLVVQAGLSSSRFFPGSALPAEVPAALIAQETLGHLSPAKLCLCLFLQAMLGKLLFGETWTPLWWVGLAMTLCGLVLLHTAAPRPAWLPAEKKEA